MASQKGRGRHDSVCRYITDQIASDRSLDRWLVDRAGDHRSMLYYALRGTRHIAIAASAAATCDRVSSEFALLLSLLKQSDVRSV